MDTEELTKGDNMDTEELTTWCDDKGFTLLMFAAERGYGKLIELLIKKGADINADDVAEYTALMYAVEANNLFTVKLLVALGADIKKVNRNGETALSIADRFDDRGIYNILENSEKEVKKEEMIKVYTVKTQQEYDATLKEKTPEDILEIRNAKETITISETDNGAIYVFNSRVITGKDTVVYAFKNSTIVAPKKAYIHAWDSEVRAFDSTVNVIVHENATASWAYNLKEEK